MKKLFATLILILISNAAYAELIFKGQDIEKTTIPTSSVCELYYHCEVSFMDVPHIVLITPTGTRLLQYNNASPCTSDYKRLQQILEKNEVRKCLKYGGGSACFVK